MSNKRLTDLTSVGAIASGDSVYIVRAGNSRAATFGDYLTAAAAAAAYQPLDSDLTALAALSTTSFGRALLELASEAAFKAALNLEANTDFYAPGGTDVAVADGGSGRSSATAYAVVCGGTTGTGAHQSIASVGTSGQVLTSNGAGTLPTFQTAASGGLTLLTSGTISSAQATLDIVLTSYTSYRAIKILLSNFVPATDDVELWCRFSTDGGSNYDATGYSYALAGFFSNGVAGNASSSAANQILIAGHANATASVSNTADEGGVDAEINLHDQTTAHWCKVRGTSAFFGALGETASQVVAGTRETSQDTDAVRFLFESGDIASGKYAVYGYT